MRENRALYRTIVSSSPPPPLPLSLSRAFAQSTPLRIRFTRVATRLHLKRILEIGRDIDANLSSWNAERLAGVTRLAWRADRLRTACRRYSNARY